MPPDPNVQPPVVVVPGITATGLEDFYPIPPEEIWSAVLTKKYERISLHPDDVRYEAIEPARVQPRALFGVIYADLVEALRHDLSPARDRPTPVFPFAYDWRQTRKSAVPRPKRYRSSSSGWWTVITTRPLGSEVVRAPCLRQKEQVSARSESSSGRALVSSESSRLPQWQRPVSGASLRGVSRPLIAPLA